MPFRKSGLLHKHETSSSDGQGGCNVVALPNMLVIQNFYGGLVSNAYENKYGVDDLRHMLEGC